MSGLRPRTPDAPGPGGGRGTDRRGLRGGAGDARPRVRPRRRGDRGLGPPQRTSRGRRRPCGGAAVPRAAGPRSGRPARGARRGRARPAGRVHDDRAGRPARPRWRARTGRSDSPSGAAAGSAGDFCRRTELLLEWWSTRPAAALRTGGLGVRELKAAAIHLHLSDTDTALVIETASGAGSDRDPRRRRRQPGLGADRRVRHVARCRPRRAVDDARPCLAREHPAPWPRRRPRGRRQAVERAHPRALLRADARDPHDDARCARRGPGGLGTGVGHRAAVPGRPAGLAAPAATAHARRPGGVDGRRGGDAGRDRPGRAVAVRPGAGRRRRPRHPCSPRCCRIRSTTCSSRPTSRPSRRARWSRASPGRSSCWRTSSRAARPPSTASPRRPYDARSMPAGRPPRCTPSSPRSRGRRSPSR